MEAALTDVLAALGDRVAPVSMARERTLPVGPQYADLFAEGALVRGRVLSCAGAAATSTALGLVAPAMAAGAWMAVIDVPTLGIDAASELGVPLERLVSITTESGDGTGANWADVVAAAADGFDVLLTRVPPDVRAGTVRKIATRLQQRGVVMIVLGDPGTVICDGVLDSGAQVWAGLGAGWGYLRQRSVDVVATGRRLPGRRCQTMTLPVSRSVEQVPVVALSTAS